MGGGASGMGGGCLSNSGTCPATQTCPFVPVNLFILSPPSAVRLSPRNQGLGEGGEEDPLLTPLLNSRATREGGEKGEKN